MATTTKPMMTVAVVEEEEVVVAVVMMVEAGEEMTVEDVDFDTNHIINPLRVDKVRFVSS